MTLYCQAGDIARVTFPDGSIQDFNDTPITIQTSEAWGDDCNANLAILIDNAYYVPNIRGPIAGFKPGLGERIAPWHPGFQVLCRGVNVGSCLPLDYYSAFTWGYSYYAYNIKIFRDGIDITNSPSYQFTVTGNSGNILLDQAFSSNNYSVECIQGCPPSTLDCGDCCLDCENILTQVCNIKRIFLG